MPSSGRPRRGNCPHERRGALRRVRHVPIARAKSAAEPDGRGRNGLRQRERLASIQRSRRIRPTLSDGAPNAGQPPLRATGGATSLRFHEVLNARAGNGTSLRRESPRCTHVYRVNRTSRTAARPGRDIERRGHPLPLRRGRKSRAKAFRQAVRLSSRPPSSARVDDQPSPTAAVDCFSQCDVPGVKKIRSEIQPSRDATICSRITCCSASISRMVHLRINRSPNVERSAT